MLLFCVCFLLLCISPCGDAGVAVPTDTSSTFPPRGGFQYASGVLRPECMSDTHTPRMPSSDSLGGHKSDRRPGCTFETWISVTPHPTRHFVRLPPFRFSGVWGDGSALETCPVEAVSVCPGEGMSACPGEGVSACPGEAVSACPGEGVSVCPREGVSVCQGKVCLPAHGKVCLPAHGEVCLSAQGKVCLSAHGKVCLPAHGEVCLPAHGEVCLPAQGKVCHSV